MIKELAEIISLLESGEWDQAHLLVQKREGTWAFDRLHALIHREEGDSFNAQYWYNRCNVSYPSNSIKEEILELKISLL